MPPVYPQVRAALEQAVRQLDRELGSITDDQLHNLVNLTSRQAAHALHRLDQIDAARQQRGG